ncbi:MAG: thiamine-phosphate kinase [Roseimicrobium sp.]
MTENLAQLGEDALIRRLTAGIAYTTDVLVGIGDDCAMVQRPPEGWVQLLKTDCIVEGVHFLREDCPRQVGWKAMARAVSDIASMGGTPQYALVTLVVPVEIEVAALERLYLGLRDCAEAFGAQIVGGETSRGPVLIVNVALTGKVKRDLCLRRSGAVAGDAIYVTGRLGGSRKAHHLTFTPRLVHGRWLAAHSLVRAMMDLSDGLAKDLPRMAEASELEFVIDEKALPVTEGCTPQHAWSDGEDYELLLAVPPHATERLEKKWAFVFQQVPLTRIGQFVRRGEGRMPTFGGSGWDHFQSTPAS